MDKDVNKIGWGTKIACFLVGWNADILRECGESSRRTLRKYMSAIIILSIIYLYIYSSLFLKKKEIQRFNQKQFTCKKHGKINNQIYD